METLDIVLRIKGIDVHDYVSCAYDSCRNHLLVAFDDGNMLHLYSLFSNGNTQYNPRCIAAMATSSIISLHFVSWLQLFVAIQRINDKGSVNYRFLLLSFTLESVLGMHMLTCSNPRHSRLATAINETRNIIVTGDYDGGLRCWYLVASTSEAAERSKVTYKFSIIAKSREQKRKLERLCVSVDGCTYFASSSSRIYIFNAENCAYMGAYKGAKQDMNLKKQFLLYPSPIDNDRLYFIEPGNTRVVNEMIIRRTSKQCCASFQVLPKFEHEYNIVALSSSIFMCGGERIKSKDSALLVIVDVLSRVCLIRIKKVATEESEPCATNKKANTFHQKCQSYFNNTTFVATSASVSLEHCSTMKAVRMDNWSPASLHLCNNKILFVLECGLQLIEVLDTFSFANWPTSNMDEKSWKYLQMYKIHNSCSQIMVYDREMSRLRFHTIGGRLIHDMPLHPLETQCSSGGKIANSYILDCELLCLPTWEYPKFAICWMDGLIDLYEIPSMRAQALIDPKYHAASRIKKRSCLSSSSLCDEIYLFTSDQVGEYEVWMILERSSVLLGSHHSNIQGTRFIAITGAHEVAINLASLQANNKDIKRVLEFRLVSVTDSEFLVWLISLHTSAKSCMDEVTWHQIHHVPCDAISAFAYSGDRYVFIGSNAGCIEVWQISPFQQKALVPQEDATIISQLQKIVSSHRTPIKQILVISSSEHGENNTGSSHHNTPCTEHINWIVSRDSKGFIQIWSYAKSDTCLPYRSLKANNNINLLFSEIETNKRVRLYACIGRAAICIDALSMKTSESHRKESIFTISFTNPAPAIPIHLEDNKKRPSETRLDVIVEPHQLAQSLMTRIQSNRKRLTETDPPRSLLCDTMSNSYNNLVLQGSGNKNSRDSSCTLEIESCLVPGRFLKNMPRIYNTFERERLTVLKRKWQSKVSIVSTADLGKQNVSSHRNIMESPVDLTTIDPKQTTLSIITLKEEESSSYGSHKSKVKPNTIGNDLILQKNNSDIKNHCTSKTLENSDLPKCSEPQFIPWNALDSRMQKIEIIAAMQCIEVQKRAFLENVHVPPLQDLILMRDSTLQLTSVESNVHFDRFSKWYKSVEEHQIPTRELFLYEELQFAFKDAAILEEKADNIDRFSIWYANGHVGVTSNQNSRLAARTQYLSQRLLELLSAQSKESFEIRRLDPLSIFPSSDSDDLPRNDNLDEKDAASPLIPWNAMNDNIQFKEVMSALYDLRVQTAAFRDGINLPVASTLLLFGRTQAWHCANEFVVWWSKEHNQHRSIYLEAELNDALEDPEIRRIWMESINSAEDNEDRTYSVKISSTDFNSNGGEVQEQDLLTQLHHTYLQPGSTTRLRFLNKRLSIKRREQPSRYISSFAYTEAIILFELPPRPLHTTSHFLTPVSLTSASDNAKDFLYACSQAQEFAQCPEEVDDMSTCEEKVIESEEINKTEDEEVVFDQLPSPREVSEPRSSSDENCTQAVKDVSDCYLPHRSLFFQNVPANFEVFLHSGFGKAGSGIRNGEEEFEFMKRLTLERNRQEKLLEAENAQLEEAKWKFEMETRLELERIETEKKIAAIRSRFDLVIGHIKKFFQNRQDTLHERSRERECHCMNDEDREERMRLMQEQFEWYQLSQEDERMHVINDAERKALINIAKRCLKEQMLIKDEDLHYLSMEKQEAIKEAESKERMRRQKLKLEAMQALPSFQSGKVLSDVIICKANINRGPDALSFADAITSTEIARERYHAVASWKFKRLLGLSPSSAKKDLHVFHGSAKKYRAFASEASNAWKDRLPEILSGSDVAGELEPRFKILKPASKKYKQKDNDLAIDNKVPDTKLPFFRGQFGLRGHNQANESCMPQF